MTDIADETGEVTALTVRGNGREEDSAGSRESARGTLARTRTRLDECADLMLTKGSAVAERELAQRWGISRRAVRRVAEKVRLVWRVQAQMEGGVDEKRDLHRRRIEHVYAASVEDGDHKSSLAALNQLAMLDGLNKDNGSPDLSWLKQAVEAGPKTEEEAVVLQEELRNTGDE